MNTPRNGPLSRPTIARSASKLSTCLPYPLRRTAMSSAWNICWSGRPSVTRSARTIIPAQVPSVGKPPRTARSTGSSRLIRSISMDMVVLSPPGMTSPSRPTRSSASRTRRTVAPHASRAFRCSRKAPWSASTPISGAFMLPTAAGEQFLLGDGLQFQSPHRLAQTGRYVGQDFRLVVVGCRGHDGLGSLQRVLRLEDTGAYEHAVGTQLHHPGGVGGRRNAPCNERDDRKPAEALDLRQQLDRGAKQLGLVNQLGIRQAVETANVAVHRTQVTRRLDDVAGAGLPLRPDHGSSLCDASEGLAQVAAAAHERHGEGPLVDVVFLVSRGQDLGLIDVVDTQRLQDLGLDGVADATLGHHRDGDGVHDRLDEGRV